LAIPFFDMVAFSVSFALAVYWRTRPEFHRRLRLIATCSLTAAAFGRFPNALMPRHWFYAGVDALILLGLVRDLLVMKRPHSVYIYGMPLMMVGQTATIFTLVESWPVWTKIARAMLGQLARAFAAKELFVSQLSSDPSETRESRMTNN
jgi:hypothetical protein